MEETHFRAIWLSDIHLGTRSCKAGALLDFLDACEPPCHDKEATLLGYNTRNKTMILGTYLLIPVANLVWSSAWTAEALRWLAATVAYEWFLWTAAVVAGRVAYLVWAHGPRLALVWFVKLVTDPVTDVIAYSPRFLRLA
jgi:glutamate-1-semialdehyde 2,1-aminomutase